MGGAALKSTAETDLVRMARSCRSRSRVVAFPERAAALGPGRCDHRGQGWADTNSFCAKPIEFSRRLREVSKHRAAKSNRLTCKGEGVLLRFCCGCQAR
jgi:hypothetical protein